MTAPTAASSSCAAPQTAVTRRSVCRRSAESRQARSRSSAASPARSCRLKWWANGRGVSRVPRNHSPSATESPTFLRSITRGLPLITEVAADTASMPVTNRSKASARRRVTIVKATRSAGTALLSSSACHCSVPCARSA
ncbi:hypothetical protein GTY53_27960 [Streptomyces sp. SID7805]|nr:hypothetical protein [Streptomyces sp. SID7805]MYU55700.1 hypothetical protein [Streptomyces sp. SID7805]